MTLGPYALALSYILTKAKSNSKVQFVYRGMRIPRQVFAEQFGYDEVDINITNVTDITDDTRSQSEVLLE